MVVRSFVVGLLLFVACGGEVAGGSRAPDGGADSAGSCVIHATSYDQSCASDADCAGVFDGNACTATCGCTNAAINRAALARYEADFPKTDGGVACPCPAELVTCQGGTCAPCTSASCFPGGDGGVRH